MSSTQTEVTPVNYQRMERGLHLTGLILASVSLLGLFGEGFWGAHAARTAFEQSAGVDSGRWFAHWLLMIGFLAVGACGAAMALVTARPGTILATRERKIQLGIAALVVVILAFSASLYFASTASFTVCC